MQDLCEKLKVYTTRYKLSDDAYAQAMIDNLNKQLTLAGMNVDTLYVIVRFLLAPLFSANEVRRPGKPRKKRPND